MKVVIVDDERLAIEVLEILLGKIPDIEIVGKFTNPLVVLDELDRIEVDTIFLDMEMGSLHGLEIAEKVMTHYPQIDIIFVTAHPQFAVEAFEVNAMDYLLKPVSSKRLEKAVLKLQGNRLLYNQHKCDEKGLFIQSMGSFRLLDTNQKEVRWRTRKAKELFSYLWHCKGKSISRSHVIEDLWGDLEKDRATTIMHTTVYQLRKTLRDLGYENPVTLTNEQYTLNIELDSDFDQLQRILQTPKPSQSLAEKAMSLYAGDYLEDASYFWALPVQQEIKQSFLTYLNGYVTEAEDDDVFIETCLEKMTSLEPFNGQYAYLLLSHYAKANKTSEMIAFFNHFRKNWIDDLGIDIPKDIQAIYEQHIMN